MMEKGPRIVRQKVAAVVGSIVVVAAPCAKKSRVLESSFCEMIEMDHISTPHVTCDWVGSSMFNPTNRL